MKKHEQLKYNVTGRRKTGNIQWRCTSHDDEVVDLAEMCTYVAEKMFIEELDLSWPAEFGRNEPPYFRVKVAKHCDSTQFLKDVVVPGAQKLLDGYFKVRYKKPYLLFLRTDTKKRKDVNG